MRCHTRARGLKPEVCQHGTVTAGNSGVRVSSADGFMRVAQERSIPDNSYSTHMYIILYVY